MSPNSEYLRGLREPEIGLPARQVCLHLFSDLSHAFATDSTCDEPYALLKRVERLGRDGDLYRVLCPPP